MADVLTPALRLTEPAIGGDGNNVWPALLNADMAYIDQGTNQTVNITISDANLTLTADGSSSDQARYLRYNFIGSQTVGRTVTLPNNQKVGWVSNNVSGGFNLTLTTGSGASLIVPPDGDWYFFAVDGSGNVALPPLGAPAHNSGRNLVHNGKFEIQQRGLGPWTSSAPNSKPGFTYTADRWFFTSGTTGSQSISIVALTDADRAAIGDESALYGAQYQFTSSGNSTDLAQFIQRVSNVRRLSGKTVTLSFWAKAATPITIAIGFDQVFGGTGSPSPAVFGVGAGTVALTTTWARYTATVSLPSAAGKSITTLDFTQLRFLYSAGSTLAPSNYPVIGSQSGTVTLWGVQLEYGAGKTPLEAIDPTQELLRCQEFYYAFAGTAGSYSVAGGLTFYAFTLPVTMMAVPLASASLSGGGNYSSWNGNYASNYSCVTLEVTQAIAGPVSFNFVYTVSGDL